MPFAVTWIQLEIIILSEVRKKIPYHITQAWNLKYGTNEPIYKTGNRLTDIENRFVVARGNGGSEMDGLRAWGW